MTEEFIIGYVPGRIRQLGFSSWHLRYRDFMVQAASGFTIDAYNELFFIVGNPDDIIVDSDYGRYDSTGAYTGENTHQHRGLITVSNPTGSNKRVEFIQVIIVK